MGEAALRGWTVGVTADRRAADQAELIARRGGRVVRSPAIRTVPLELDDGVATAIEAVAARRPDIVVLSTGVGTRALLDAADSLGLGDDVRSSIGAAEVLVRGPKAKGAAVTAGLPVAWQAPGATSAEIVARLEQRGVAGSRIAVQLDGQDVPRLADAIRQLGADVVALPIYRWTHAADVGPVVRMIDAACDGHVDAVTFTSAAALRNVLDLADTSGRLVELRRAFDGRVAAVSIGPVCTAAARAAGIEPVVEPARARLGAMVMALAAHAAAVAATSTRRVAGRAVELRASTVVVDGTVVEMPPREHAILAMLIEHAGSVVAKDRLRRGALPATADDHAVEVTVARVRRRLGPLLTIRAVPRRGYVLTA